MKRRFAMAICIGVVWIAGAARGGASEIPRTPYREIDVREAGTIRGTVRLNSTPVIIEKMTITKDNKHCGSVKVSPRLTLGKGNAVANAFIILDGISEGKAMPSGMKHVLNQYKCEYSPHALLVPLGSQLEIVNSDPILHNVHAYEEKSGARSVFNIAQPIKGLRTMVKQQQLNKPGFVVATCDAGHPWMSATILVTGHPYCALTDARGNFEINGVPPGTYKIKMWHEGVAVTNKIMEHGKVTKYDFEPPYEVAKEITVTPNAECKTDFELTLR